MLLNPSLWFTCNDHFAVVPRKDATVYFRAHKVSLLPCVPKDHITRYACHMPFPVYECFLSYALISSNVTYSGFLHNQQNTPMPPGGPHGTLWSVIRHVDKNVKLSDIDTYRLFSVAKLKQRAPEFERMHQIFKGWDENGHALLFSRKMGRLVNISKLT